MEYLQTGLFLVLSYLLGSIPFGLILTKMAGLGDIRAIGSGSIGATNVLRTGSKKLALATLILDGGKGALALLLFGSNPWYLLAAILGHNFPVWLKFKGGKGVATTFGGLLVLNPLLALCCGVTWLLTAIISRISSLSAIIAGIAMPIFGFFLDENVIALLILSVLAIYRHKSNIQRLLKGEEPKIGKK
ncbi:MAG: glycerol-3-phosphate 1-O-acyltransferase PlsY [Alphaproteobacteria bacterium]|nr:glycerol-3-phosphate 1-O-acyltransferase PlsY [Alphaproteobacteria bacterium]